MAPITTTTTYSHKDVILGEVSATKYNKIGPRHSIPNSEHRKRREVLSNQQTSQTMNTGLDSHICKW